MGRHHVYYSLLRGAKKRSIKAGTMLVASVLAVTSLSGGLPLLLTSHAYAITPIDITNAAELQTAIANQADGQVWNIEPGTYGLTQNTTISAGGQTGWYFPVTASNITINGIGNPTIYGDSYTANGNWATQDLMAIFGNHVTINGLTLMPKVEPNKTIEVIGDSETIENVTLKPNTLTNQADYANISDPSWAQEAKTWGGSIYYNNATGTQTLDNITIYNGGVSVHSPGVTINVNSVHFSYTSDVDWLNDYRFYVASPTSVINGNPDYTYHVNNTLNNFDSVLAAVGDPTTAAGTDTISLDTDISTAKQITLTKPVILNGNGHTISPTFTKTDNDNNSALGIQANNVTVNNLIEDGTAGTNLHGINVFAATGVNLNDVTLENNGHSGLNVNSSAVTVNNLTTAHNGWGGADVDKTGAVLTVNGTSHHTETAPDIYVDNTAIGKVIDTNNQYGFVNNVKQAGDRVYNLKPAVPTALLFDANNSPVTNGYITTKDFAFHLTSSSNVTRYQLKYWNAISGSAFNGESHAWSPTDLSAAGHMSVLGTYTDNFTQGQGIHDFAFSACDAYGVCSDFSSPFVVTYDSTAPAAPTINYPANNAFIANIQHVTWTSVTDDFANPVSYIYQSSLSSVQNPDGSFASPVYTSGPLSAPQIPTPGTPEGVYYLHVQAIDAAGNKSSWSTVVKVTIDNTAPVAHITAPTASLLHGKVTVNGTVTDVNPDHYYFVVQDSHGTVVAGPGVVYAAQVTPWTWDTNKVADGTYTIVLGARDKAGNKDTASTATMQVTVDNTAPVDALTTPDPNANNNKGSGLYVVTGTVTDASFDLSQTVFSLVADNNNPQNTPVAPVSGSLKEVSHVGNVHTVTATFDSTVLSNGVYKVSLVSTDLAGSVGNTATADVTINNSSSSHRFTAAFAPAPTTTQNNNGNTNGTNGNVLGDSTTAPGTTSTTGGQVKGDSTSTPNNVTIATVNNKHALYGLGWWWLVVMAGLGAGMFWLLFGRRRHADDDNS